ncbi:DoxX family protein [Terricaulis silvestris]|uniref:DoxX n=1 Tax=Terricaulis silvestris TaxID=2686094 RepID=A0A6I6MR99_9CAUL|nr:hypothetical protein [Terricaulis silvestris]QGZ95946.1 hypothetical protein DSM104635_02801 [Terricaulis silvestris]
MIQLGRQVYGLAAIATGAVGLAWGDFAAVWQPFPDDAPARPSFAYAIAGVFLVSGILLQWRRTASIGAAACAALGLMFAFFWLSMRLVTAPQTYVFYNGVSEQLAIGLGGVAAFASLSAAAWAPRLALVARIVFGVCCVVFGGAHFVYVNETAAMVPSYLPLGGTIWAQVTGVCHAAAGLALISGFFALPAARLLTLMFIGFGALVWAPQILVASAEGLGGIEHIAWAGNAINLSLIGAAWMIGDMIAGARTS